MRPRRAQRTRRHFIGCVVGVLATGMVGCADKGSESRDPGRTVRAFYKATLEADADAACRLLMPTAKTLLTLKQPPPACEVAIDHINGALTARERRDMTRGLRADRAIRVSRHGPTADVDLASRDSSVAGIHLQRIEGEWRIEGIDPGAVDGGQPTGDAAAIRRLQRHSR